MSYLHLAFCQFSCFSHLSCLVSGALLTFTSSAVFAASYRITVFIHDVSQDMTYTLAPDAGWVTIEQAAAVSSASFPTLGPALLELFHQLRRLFGLSNRPGHKQAAAMRQEEAANSNRNRCSNPEDDDDVLIDLTDFVKAQYNPSTSHARPMTNGTEEQRDKALSLTTTKSQGGDSDEIPLNAVRVQKV